jgi:hypothetical protein
MATSIRQVFGIANNDPTGQGSSSGTDTGVLGLSYDDLLPYSGFLRTLAGTGAITGQRYSLDLRDVDPLNTMSGALRRRLSRHAEQND